MSPDHTRDRVPKLVNACPSGEGRRVLSPNTPGVLAALRSAGGPHRRHPPSDDEQLPYQHTSRVRGADCSDCAGRVSHPTVGPTAYLSEVFASVEGEGLFVGQPAVFVRLAGCNLRCAYCDTKYAWENPGAMLVYEGDATREVANPVSAADLAALVAEGFMAVPTAVFTGGEPLLQAEFLGVVMRELRGLGYQIHLETNGTLASAFLTVKDVVDFVSMDIKLPSSQGGRDLAAEHLDFLRAVEGKRAAVKIVVTADFHERELEDAIRLVASVNRFLPVILQPAFVDARPAVGADRLTRALGVARRGVHDARLSIQMHKVIGAR